MRISNKQFRCIDLPRLRDGVAVDIDPGSHRMQPIGSGHGIGARSPVPHDEL